MKVKCVSLVCSVIMLVLFQSQVLANETCSKEAVAEAVDKAVALLEAEGAAGLEKVGEMRFCGDNYVFVNDLKGKTLMHANKALIGKVLIALKDDTGKRFFADFSEVAKSAETSKDGATCYTGSGWVDYRWPRPKEKEFLPKTSYIKACMMGGENVYVGAGVYL